VPRPAPAKGGILPALRRKGGGVGPAGPGEGVEPGAEALDSRRYGRHGFAGTPVHPTRLCSAVRMRRRVAGLEEVQPAGEGAAAGVRGGDVPGGAGIHWMMKAPAAMVTQSPVLVDALTVNL
jgi:hypothetical protein